MLVCNHLGCACINLFTKGVVMFNQSTYEVVESEPQLQAMLVVNDPLDSDIELHVEASSITATGIPKIV